MSIDSLKQTFVDMIDAVVYINLDHRTDRNDHMLEIVKIFGQKVQRFEAIETYPGFIGCSESHAAVMRMAIESNWKNILVLEDDVLWNENIDAYTNAIELLTKPYDVIMLGSYRTTYDADTQRIKSGHGYHAYVVNRHYFKTFHSNIDAGLTLLKASEPAYPFEYRVDNYKNKLAAQDNWYAVMPNLFYQMDGFSDILKQHRNLVNTATLITPDIIKRKSIHKVYWGADTRMIDVTDEFQSIPSGNIQVSYKLFKLDPAIGSKKMLIIEYVNGENYIKAEYSTITIVNR